MKVGLAPSAIALALAFRTAPAQADVPGPAPQTSHAPALQTLPPSRSDESAVPSGPDRGFAALWVTPLATHWFQGAGFEAGYRYGTFAGLVREGFVQNDYAPVSGTPVPTLQRTRRFSFDLEADVHWRAANAVAFDVGGGLGFLDDVVNITSMNGLTWTTVSRAGWRVAYFGRHAGRPAVRSKRHRLHRLRFRGPLALGVCWGRLNRP